MATDNSRRTADAIPDRITGTRRDAASAHEPEPSTVYFDPDRPVGKIKGNLPHWRQDGVTYFVTFRLADSIPRDKLHQWLADRDQWLKHHPLPHDNDARREFNRRFTQRLQQWLDAGYGECILGRPDVRILVADAVRHFDGQHYMLADWVIMPNHVHVLVSPLDDRELSSILHSWKSYTAKAVNRLLGRQGSVWQKESFDHIVRTAASFEWIARYIQENPISLQPDTFSLHVKTTFQ